MPKNGDVNESFGVYRNVCCGQEIIIRQGAKFPDCKKHSRLSTVWKPIEIDVSEVIVFKKSKTEPAA